MQIRKSFWFVLSLALFLVSQGCTSSTTPAAPKITLSATRIPAKGNLNVHGEGFSPKADIVSHLRRPNGTEFPELPMVTDNRGEFEHEIETLLLAVGTHEVWVIDKKTGVSSNIATFEVTLDQPPPSR